MAKPKSTIGTLQWTNKLVNVKDIKKTPKNYKIKTDLGRERLQHSLKQFGLAGAVVINTDYTLIDGNSRLEEAIESGEKKIWASIPKRKLTAKEFQEMSAMYDFAKAGEVDMESIEKDLGTTADWYKRWGKEVPLALLEKMGKQAPIEALQYPGNGGGKNGTAASDDTPVSDIRMVNLFFSEKQEAAFRKWEEKAMKKFKTANTTDTVYKALMSIKL